MNPCTATRASADRMPVYRTVFKPDQDAEHDPSKTLYRSRRPSGADLLQRRRDYRQGNRRNRRSGTPRRSIVAFAEIFIPGFPVWAAGLAPIDSHDHFRQFAAASISATGPELQRVRAAAERHSIVVSLGFSETNPASVGGLWNSNLLIGDRGDVLLHHRKLVPTRSTRSLSGTLAMAKGCAWRRPRSAVLARSSAARTPIPWPALP